MTLISYIPFKNGVVIIADKLSVGRELSGENTHFIIDKMRVWKERKLCIVGSGSTYIFHELFSLVDDNFTLSGKNLIDYIVKYSKNKISQAYISGGIKDFALGFLVVFLDEGNLTTYAIMNGDRQKIARDRTFFLGNGQDKIPNEEKTRWIDHEQLSDESAIKLGIKINDDVASKSETVGKSDIGIDIAVLCADKEFQYIPGSPAVVKTIIEPESKKLLSLLKTMKENSYLLTSEDIEKLLQNKSKDDMIILFNLMLGENIWSYYKIITYKFSSLVDDSVDTEEIVRLFARIVEAIKSDWAQGDFIRALIELGKDKPELSFKFVDKIIRMHINDISIEYAGLLIGGIGKVEENKIMGLVKNVLAMEEYYPSSQLRKVAAIKALRVMIEAKKVDPGQAYFDVVENLTNGDESILTELALYYIELYVHRQKYCFNKVYELIQKNASDKLHFSVSQTLRLKGLSNIHDAFELIQLIYNQKVGHSEQNVVWFLSKYLMINKQKTFDLFKRMISDRNFRSSTEMDYLVQQMWEKDAAFFKYELVRFVDQTEDLYIINEIKFLLHSFPDPDLENKVMEKRRKFGVLS